MLTGVGAMRTEPDASACRLIRAVHQPQGASPRLPDP
jgi:hypothetical protein